MAKLEFVHPFEVQEAIDRVRALTDYWGNNYGVTSDWTARSASIAGKVKGASFTGQVQFEDGIVRAEIKAGFLAEKLGGRAYVERKIKDYLNPKNSLESLRARVP